MLVGYLIVCYYYHGYGYDSCCRVNRVGNLELSYRWILTSHHLVWGALLGKDVMRYVVATYMGCVVLCHMTCHV